MSLDTTPCLAAKGSKDKNLENSKNYTLIKISLKVKSKTYLNSTFSAGKKVTN